MCVICFVMIVVDFRRCGRQGLEFGGDGYTEYAESVVSHKPKVRGGVFAPLRREQNMGHRCRDSPFRLVWCGQRMCDFSVLRMELLRFFVEGHLW